MSAAESGMSVNVHPLVIMNIADHYTRSTVQYQEGKVYGALFGVQNGRDVQVYDSFEFPNEDADKTTEQRLEAFEEDRQLYVEVYSNREFLGWYTTGTAPTEADKEFHQVLLKYNERPLFLLMDTKVDSEARDLPVTVFEHDVHADSGTQVFEFVRTAFTISSDEAERIAAVHCADVVSTDDAKSAVTPHFNSLHKAIKSLNERVRVLHTFLRDVASGKVQADVALLREVKGICNRLPTMDSTVFQKQFMNEFNDALLVTYLASITQGSEAINEVVEKFDAAYGMQGRTGRKAMRQMMF